MVGVVIRQRQLVPGRAAVSPAAEMNGLIWGRVGGDRDAAGPHRWPHNLPDDSTRIFYLLIGDWHGNSIKTLILRDASYGCE